MLFEIKPVLFAAFVSAVTWNFFFIPPVFTFHIDKTEDILMFLLYFIVALVNTVLNFKIRKEEKKTRDKEEKERQIVFYNTLLNSLSHELKTPIATIIGAVDTLQEPSIQLQKTQEYELLNQINQASERLERQVENLLNMSRIQSEMLQMNYDWCDSNELIFSSIQLCSDRNSHTILFQPNETLPLIKIDRGLIEQVIYNLIHNAIRYTPKQSTVWISSECENENWIVKVSDNGPGINENHLQQIFDQFYRVPNTKTGGTGLGLSLVKGFVEMHNGMVTSGKNEKGHLEFTIVIPAEQSFINSLNHE